MSAYMGQRIIDGAQEYTFVIGKRPDLKIGIDSYLISKGKDDLIV